MRVRTFILGMAFLAPGLAFAAGEGAPYGTRDPAICASTAEPKTGAISADLAKRYLACHLEGVSGPNMYLVENVQVQVGKGTPFLQLDFGQRPGNADPDGLVYAIRGSYRLYQCARPSAFMQNTGKNCTARENPNATGECYRSGFGDWVCNMQDLAAINNGIPDQPPPR